MRTSKRLNHVSSSSQYLSIELSHSDRFWVENVVLDRLIEGVAMSVFRLMEGLQCVSQDGVDGGLPSASGPHQHDTVTH